MLKSLGNQPGLFISVISTAMYQCAYSSDDVNSPDGSVGEPASVVVPEAETAGFAERGVAEGEELGLRS